MGEQKDRVYEVRIGPPGIPGAARGWRDLDMEFTVTHDSGRMPNEAEVTLYNLSDDAIGFIEQTGNVLQLLVGYGLPGLLFQGRVRARDVHTRWNHPTRVTQIKAKDADLAFREAEFNQAYEGPVSNQQLIVDIAASMGVGIRHIDPLLGTVDMGEGAVYMGSARKALDEVLEGSGARWTIADGLLQVLVGNGTLPDQAFVISPGSGLVGSPERTDSGLNVVALLNSRLRPGNLIQVLSRDVNGFYRIKKLVHSGSYHDTPWYSKMEATPA